MAAFQDSFPTNGVTLLIVLAQVWAVALATALMLVMPILAVVKSLRQPPWWLAAIIGAVSGLIGAASVVGPSQLARSSMTALVGFGMAGAASGIVYVIATER